MNEAAPAAAFLTPSAPLPPYLAYPRFLLDMNISETAKLVYAMLLDRARLSMKNDGWTDKNGKIFLYFTIANLATAIHRSEMTVKTALNTLSENGLIFRQRQGAGNPNRIYVKIPVQTDNFLSIGEQKNCLTDGQIAVRQRAEKLSTNNNEKNYTNRTKQENDSQIIFGRYKNVFLTQKELAALQSDFPDWAERVERLSSYMESTGKRYQSHIATIRLWAEKDKSITPKRERSYKCKEDESL